MTKAEFYRFLTAPSDFLPRTRYAGSSNEVRIADLRTATCSDSLSAGSLGPETGGERKFVLPFDWGEVEHGWNICE